MSCFAEVDNDMTALSFQVSSHTLFYAETGARTISSVHITTGKRAALVVNTGAVGGKLLINLGIVTFT